MTIVLNHPDYQCFTGVTSTRNCYKVQVREGHRELTSSDKSCTDPPPTMHGPEVDIPDVDNQQTETEVLWTSPDNQFPGMPLPK